MTNHADAAEGLVFVQIVRGVAADPAALYARVDHWVEHLGPQASGWLGTTSGLTTGGEFVACVRFATAAAAAHNQSHPEQQTWWEETRSTLSAVSFQDYDDVQLTRNGGSDEARFVQVMLGELTDYGCEHGLDGPVPEPPAGVRPEVLGGYVGIDLEAGRFAQVVYFTSEQEARAAERREQPEMAEAVAERTRMVANLEYLDLPNPRLDSP